MVVLNRIYTRSGDSGMTALGSGKRVAKTHHRIAAYGAVDEANATIGIARLHLNICTRDQLLAGILGRVQNDLFDLGADLCVPPDQEKPDTSSLRIIDAQVDRLETEIDRLNADLAPLRSFIIPGGSAAATYLHLARTTARRAERLMWQLAEHDDEPVGAAALRYINRLSDLLFVASRYANADTNGDVLWVPGASRDG